MALSAVKLELDRYLLFARIGRHYRLHRVAAALHRERLGKRGYHNAYRLDIELLTDNARRSYEYVVSVNIERLSGKLAHLLGDLNAVGIAGVRVAAVHDNSLSVAVF